MESLELTIARHRIACYEHDADEMLIRASQQAQECLDCEAFLEKGIEAFAAIVRFESLVTEAAADGLIEATQEVDVVIESLYKSWIRPCQYATKWITVQERRGFEIRNLAKFRDACERAEEWLARNENYKLAKLAREEKFAEEPW